MTESVIGRGSNISWIGKIPANWKIVRNKNVFTCTKALVGDKSSEYQLLSLTTTGIRQKSKDETGGKIPESYDTYQAVEKDDIVLCLFDLDCSAVFSGISPFDGMISPAYKVLKCKNNTHPQYADYWFRSVFDGRKFMHFAKNIRYSLTYEDFSSLPIPLPPLSEQEAIIAFLNQKCENIDSLISEAKASIEEYKAWKASIIYEAVTKGLDPHVEMKESGVPWIGSIPKGWNVIRLKFFISGYKAGPFGSSLITDNLEKEGETLVYTPEHIAKKRTDLDNNLYLPAKRTEEMCQFFISPGDIIFPIVGSLGRAMIITHEMPRGIINQRLAKFRLNSELLNTDYFLWLFSKSSFYSTYIDLNCRGSIIVNLTKQIVGNMPVVLPASIKEQEEICNYLDQKCGRIDSLITEKEALILDLESFKKSLIFEVVTGKRRVC